MTLGTVRQFAAFSAVLGTLIFLGVNYVNSQDPSLATTYGSIRLVTGFLPDPFTKELTAGGNIATNRGGVNMHIADAPDFRLDYEAGRLALTIYAESNADTTLLVKAPDGKWYANDDQSPTNRNPLLHFDSPKSGTYLIWVGTFNKELAPAVLKITELK